MAILSLVYLPLSIMPTCYWYGCLPSGLVYYAYTLSALCVMFILKPYLPTYSPYITTYYMATYSELVFYYMHA